jgi:hypothetical protein
MRIGESKLLRIADFKSNPVARAMRLRELDVRCGGINPEDAAGWRDSGDGSRQRTSPATDVEYEVAVPNAGESHEEWSELAAPPAHEPLVRMRA